MAHKKATGAKARQGGNVRGKRLGLKVSGGEKVKVGNILVKQVGSKFNAGDNVKTGRDFTLFAVKDGQVNFKQRQGKKYVEVKELKKDD